MCNVYVPPSFDSLNARWVRRNPLAPWGKAVAPLLPGPIVRRGGVLDVGQWGLIPHGSPTRKPTRRDGKPMSTNNCRRETVASAWTFRFPWARGQRCLIPAQSYDEPYWGTGRNIWWRFARADGQPWMLGGIWAEWTDPGTGEVVLSYSMLTQNCDAHPLLKLFHKPDPKLPADQQDKRSVVPIEEAHWDQWLDGSPDDAERLIHLPAPETIKHGAADPAKQVALPL